MNRYWCFLFGVYLISQLSVAQLMEIRKFYEVGDYINCTERITKKLNDPNTSKDELYLCYHFLSEIKRTNNDFQDALDVQLKSEPFAQSSKRKLHYFNRRGAIFYQWTQTEKSKGDSALYYLNKSMKICKETGNLEFEVNNLNLIATLYTSFLDNPEKSLELFRKGIKIADENNFEDLQIQLNTNITIPLTKLKRFKDVEYHLLKIKPLVDSLNIPIYKLDLHQKLATNYHHLGNYKSEVKTLRREISLTEDLFNNQEHKAILEIEEKYKSQLKDLQNKQLQLEGKRKSRIIYIIIGFLIIAVLFLFLFTRLNKKLTSSNSKLEESVNLNKRIFSILSHDLKQPIISLQSMFFLLDNDLLSSSEKEENMVLIKNYLKTTSLFMDDLMSWSKLELGKSKKYEDSVLVYSLIQRVMDLYKLELLEKELKVDYGNIDKGRKLNMNEMLLFIVLKNTISNAIKYSYPNTVIQLGLSQEKGKNVFLIRNMGKPIPESIKKNMFNTKKSLNRFVRNDSKLGFGLGLSIISKLIDDNNGKIWLEDLKDDNHISIKFYL
jgi:signal transduction histidine kinase